MIDPHISKKDKKFLRIALNLARRNVGLTGKNPSVGCIITYGDVILGRGNTQFNGRPHAEENAIEMAGKEAVGSTIYVTCLLYTSPSPRDSLSSRMPSSA